MMSTCSISITKEEVELCLTNFNLLYNVVAEKGMIKEILLDLLGFRKDTRFLRNIVEQIHEITSEHQQRCTIINHIYQNMLRKAANCTYVVDKVKLNKDEVAKLEAEVDELVQI